MNVRDDWNLPPGLPHSLPFYALKPWVKLGEPIRLFEYLHRTYGSIAHYRFMGTPILFVNDPEFIREILVTQSSAFVKERTVRRMKILLGEGLITSDDPIHIRQRRIVAPAFHRQRIAAYADEIVASTHRHAASWNAGEAIDISSAMMSLSLEIVARTLFDTEVTEDILAINDEVNTIMDLYNFLIAFPRMESVLHLPIPGVMKFRRSRARLDKVVNRLIREHREANVDKGDLLSMLIRSRDEQAETGVSATMSDEQVRDEAMTIFLAGYETTANALAWTWYLLSQNPQAEARLHQEIDQVLGTGANARLPTLADYPALQYTERVFAESMRIYPPAWAMGRMSTQPITLGPYRIPPGAHFFMSQYMISRTPEIYPDPLRFDPERFTPEAKSARSRFAYFPFGAGSRQCIGESFAWMEGVLAIATIAQRWSMQYLGAEPPIPQAKITLRPRDPVVMRLIER
jgi:cytochrome P450